MVKAVINPDVHGLGKHITSSGKTISTGDEPVEVTKEDLEVEFPFGGVMVHPLVTPAEAEKLKPVPPVDDIPPITETPPNAAPSK